MTRLAFLIGFAIGAWWVLRERRERERIYRVSRYVYSTNARSLDEFLAAVQPPDPYPSSLLRPNGWDG